MKKISIFSVCLTIVLAACNSDDDTSPQAAKEFPLDTEWVGVLDRSGYQFAPPAYLRFKGNDKLVVYAPHFFFENGKLTRLDSVNGSITSISQVDGATIEVKSDIDHYGLVTMTIKDKRQLTAKSNNGSKPTPFTLELYDTPLASLSGSMWSGPTMTGSGPTAGRVAYPDLSTIIFGDKVTTYGRSGGIVLNTPETPASGALEVGYTKKRAMVFMSGYNETNGYLYPYFGVLLPGNDRMMVYSGGVGARLPYHTQNIPWDGPIGQTPVIERR